MPYNPELQATQTMRRPYKAALIKLATHNRRNQQQQIEQLIAQACAAQGIRVEEK